MMEPPPAASEPAGLVGGEIASRRREERLEARRPKTIAASAGAFAVGNSAQTRREQGLRLLVYRAGDIVHSSSPGTRTIRQYDCEHRNAMTVDDRGRGPPEMLVSVVAMRAGQTRLARLIVQRTFRGFACGRNGYLRALEPCSSSGVFSVLSHEGDEHASGRQNSGTGKINATPAQGAPTGAPPPRAWNPAAERSRPASSR